MAPLISVIGIKTILDMTYFAGLVDLNRCSLRQLSQSLLEFEDTACLLLFQRCQGACDCWAGP